MIPLYLRRNSDFKAELRSGYLLSREEINLNWPWLKISHLLLTQVYIRVYMYIYINICICICICIYSTVCAMAINGRHQVYLGIVKTKVEDLRRGSFVGIGVGGQHLKLQCDVNIRAAWPLLPAKYSLPQYPGLKQFRFHYTDPKKKAQ